jgi:predicted DNA-binding WGR domain protein
MRSTLTIGAEYLVHSGGTKYYEIVTFLNEEAKKFIEVRRWGAMATAKSGGGQTQTIEHDTAAQALESVRKQLSAKRRKDYVDKTGGFGVHVHTGSQTLSAARTTWIKQVDLAFTCIREVRRSAPHIAASASTTRTLSWLTSFA